MGLLQPAVLICPPFVIALIPLVVSWVAIPESGGRAPLIAPRVVPTCGSLVVDPRHGEEISTMISLLPAARGCDDAASRRQPTAASRRQPTDGLPLRCEAKYSERICHKSNMPKSNPEDMQAAIPVVLS